MIRSARGCSRSRREQRLAAAHTWPFDASTLVRFALYVAVGVGSWIGGALVERAVGVALE